MKNKKTETAKVFTTEMIAVKRIRSNRFNANVLTDEQQDGVKQEMVRQKRVTKPIVVRPTEKGDFVVIDGGKTVAAAKKLKYKEVPCIIERCDEYEGLRQSYVRNKHGEIDKIKAGLFIRRMQRLNNVSNRELAADLAVSEGTVRNYQLCFEAFEIRRVYTNNKDDAQAQIYAMTINQVRKYLKLPSDQRDEWLDRGCLSAEVRQTIAESQQDQVEAEVDSSSPQPASEPNRDQSATISNMRSGTAAVGEQAALTPSSGVISGPMNGSADGRIEESESNDVDLVEDGPELGNSDADQSQILEQLKQVWNQATITTRQRFFVSQLADLAMSRLLRQIFKTQPK